MKTVTITSPAGSGMNFAQEVIRLSFDVQALTIGYGHERSDIETKKSQISILRNPYEAVASGAERWLKTSNHKTFLDLEERLVEIDNVEAVKNCIKSEAYRYIEFFKDIDLLDHVKVVSFELITENTDKFLDVVKDYFEITNPKKEVSKENVFEKLVDSNNSNRAPREKDDSRKVVDNLVAEMYPKETWEAWKIYLDIKSRLDKDGL